MRLVPEGRSSSRPAYICAADDDEAVSRSAKAKELETKTGELLKAAGFEHYRQYRGMWRRSFYTISGKEQTEMEYIITYTPVVDGVGCTANMVNLFATSYLYGLYIEVYYDEEQPVVTVKDVKLEYAFLQKEGAQPDELELAPVWNFYGSIKKVMSPRMTVL